MWRIIFGARAQVAIGAACLVVAVAAWIYGATLRGDALLRLLFHVSMFFGAAACYAIVATGLGYRATERVEQVVVEQADDVDIDVS